MKTMKTKTYYFTKIITFCVLSLFLITNMILFTSCDNGNSPNNNTNEEQNNNAPTDYCKICDGVQDKDHQHDYCGECEGDQTDPKHICPEPTLSAEVEHIGNGTYTIANFMVNDNAEDSIDQKVADGLECAEKHIKDFADCFENTANNQNLQNLVNVLGTESTYNTNNTTGFDPIINKLNNACAPIFEEIIEKIDNDLDVAYFKNEYKGLSLKAYKKGWGNYFEGSVDNIEPQEETYNTKKDSLNKAWAMMHALNSIDQEFSIVEDIENNNCKNITTHMDELLLKHDIANDLGITKDDLKNFINLSLTITSLDAMHDNAVQNNLSTHVVTDCDGLDNELTKL